MTDQHGKPDTLPQKKKMRVGWLWMIYICVAGKGFRRKQMPSIVERQWEQQWAYKPWRIPVKPNNYKIGLEWKHCPLSKVGQL